MPKKEGKQKKDLLNMDVSLGGVNLSQKALLAKHLAVMQKSGLTITESLQIVQESAKGKMKKVIAGVLKSVEAGNSLSSSIARYPKVFSEVFISSVYAGETSGTLEENLDNLAEQMKKDRELISKIKGAMLYPIIILIASFALGMAMSFLVLPKIIPLFKGLKTELPFSTRALIWFSEIVDQHGLVLFVGIIFAVLFFWWLFTRKFFKPILHWMFLKIPIIKGVIYNANLARFSRTLGTLLKSGLSITESIEITSKTVGNHYYRKSLKEALGRVDKGIQLSEVLEDHKKLYPSMVIRMINVGEESGNLEDTLMYLASFYEVEVDNATKSLSTAIEPVLLLGIGVLVGFLALSIITPIYNITGNIKR